MAASRSRTKPKYDIGVKVKRLDNAAKNQEMVITGRHWDENEPATPIGTQEEITGWWRYGFGGEDPETGPTENLLRTIKKEEVKEVKEEVKEVKEEVKEVKEEVKEVNDKVKGVKEEVKEDATIG
jgi:hypothetical protein